jgi:hypothetical protein
MEVIPLLCAFIIGVATAQVYQRYRATHEIAWNSLIMGIVFILVAMVSKT